MSYMWPETLISADVDGAAVTGTTAATLLHPTAVYTFKANELRLNDKFRIRAAGRISNIVTTPGTLTLDIRAAGVVAFNGGAMSLNVVAKTNVTWMADIDLVVRAIGSGTNAQLFGIGKFISESVIGSPLPTVGGSGVLLMPASAPAVGTGFDSTAAVALNMFAAFSLTGNSIQLHQFSVQRL